MDFHVFLALCKIQFVPFSQFLANLLTAVAVVFVRNRFAGIIYPVKSNMDAWMFLVVKPASLFPAFEYCGDALEKVEKGMD